MHVYPVDGFGIFRKTPPFEPATVLPFAVMLSENCSRLNFYHSIVTFF